METACDASSLPPRDPTTAPGAELAALRAEVTALRAEVERLQAFFGRSRPEGGRTHLTVDAIRCQSISFGPTAEAEYDTQWGAIQTSAQGSFFSLCHRSEAAPGWAVHGRETVVEIGTGRWGARYGESAEEGLADVPFSPRILVAGHTGESVVECRGFFLTADGKQYTTSLSGNGAGTLILGAPGQPQGAVVAAAMPWGGEVLVNFHGTDRDPQPMQAGVLYRNGMMRFAIAPDVALTPPEEQPVYLGTNRDRGGTLVLRRDGTETQLVATVAPDCAFLAVQQSDALANPEVPGAVTEPTFLWLGAGGSGGAMYLSNELGVQCLSCLVHDDAGLLTVRWAGQERLRLHAVEQTGVVLSFDASGYPNATLPPDIDTAGPG
jgi:hypothetical protein